MELKTLIENEKIIAIIRGISLNQIYDTVLALRSGGIRLVEVTFSQSSENCLGETHEAIHSVVNAFEDMAIGAGTVVTVEQVRSAHDAGAEYIISPNTNESVIKETKALGMLSIPGAFTPSEIMQAHEYGADYVKLFPVGNLGAAYVKAVRSPISHITLLGVGGINETNMKEFFDAGIRGFGIGGNLVSKKLIDAVKFDELAELAAKYVKISHSL